MSMQPIVSQEQIKAMREQIDTNMNILEQLAVAKRAGSQVDDMISNLESINKELDKQVREWTSYYKSKGIALPE